jgi:hypothetical protein
VPLPDQRQLAQQKSETSPFRYWLGQLGGVMKQVLIVTLAGLSIALLMRFGGKAAALIALPLILLFGTGLYGWLRYKTRPRSAPVNQPWWKRWFK